MSPLHIQLILHYHISPEPYAQHEPQHAKSLAVTEYRAQLLHHGLLEHWADGPDSVKVTERGKVYIEGLRAVPLPIQKWVMP